MQGYSKCLSALLSNAPKRLAWDKVVDPFFGVQATGREIAWSGAAFFKIEDGLIAELWVLGDIDAVKRQLMPDGAYQGFSMA
jgi:predicted ester cyclase